MTKEEYKDEIDYWDDPSELTLDEMIEILNFDPDDDWDDFMEEKELKCTCRSLLSDPDSDCPYHNSKK